VFVRGAEAGALPVAGKYGLGALTWSPLNSGWLTGRFAAASRSNSPHFGRRLPGSSTSACPATSESSTPLSN
jgi:aryl-alcohol dehydrogenase-like predicted oxidoreductase